ncbi:Leucine rich repeat/RNI-like superfamily protein [Klebsormidium nitens]|uniref:Leucine rich repeat/RNI-like superfamily protein n=1 Tax=Klebsormidium nitens TaxID=105231 RepID=A0A1Y1IN82_KLENI|nr:Leucine rich repeat/RNI-like superfamily protein [Klebsormidium nitens]|eukprot:GAQ90067.1 Leucine rich repeat/RNI-like superfamily protein [Klebsormidium nitens]
MEFFSRLTPFEERVWEIVEGAFALGDRIAHQVFRATGDAAGGTCEALFSPLCESAPLSQSSPLSSSQVVEALASSALPQEQHTCEMSWSLLWRKTSWLLHSCLRALSCASGACVAPLRGHCLRVGTEEGAGSGRSQSLVLAEPSGDACHFERLDRGCVYEFLQKLSNTHLKVCSLVCREWLEVSSEARHTMTLERAPHSAALPVLLHRFSQLRIIKIWDEAAVACPDDAFVNHLARQTLLEQLDVKGCGALSDAGLGAVLRGCPGLRSLVLRQCPKVRGRGFEGLRCKLEVLELDSCDAVTDDGIGSIAGACPGLVRLVVRMGSEDTDLLAEGLEQIAKRCPGLRELILHASWVKDKTLQAFAAGCPGLSCVELSCEHGVSDEGVSVLTSRCHQLRTLGLINNPWLFFVPRSRSGLQLKTLKLGWFTDTLDSVLRRVSEEVGLEELLIMGCPKLTDTTVEKILGNCQQLKRLGLQNNERLTPGVLRAHSKCGSKALLEIRDCKGIDPSTLLQQMPVSLDVQIT